jgi:hypothetical protein
MTNVLQEMLLIDEPSVFRLYKEMIRISGYFIPPFFLIALVLEFLGEMNFGMVVKKLLIVTIIMSSFYVIHTKTVEISLDSASKILKKVSPRNLFVKKWYHPKIRTIKKSEWGVLESIAIPNLNDLLATAYFLMAKVFIWILKLIYSSVYHLTYIFSGITALLYFLGWTKDSLKGTIQSSLWCIIMPFVVVSILALVGNSINEKAITGQNAIADIDTILWLFGITLLLLLTPVITLGMVRGDGIAFAGSKMGSLAVSTAMKTGAVIPFVIGRGKSIKQKIQRVRNGKGTVNNLNKISKSNSAKYSDNSPNNSINNRTHAGERTRNEISKVQKGYGIGSKESNFTKESYKESSDSNRFKQNVSNSKLERVKSNRPNIDRKPYEATREVFKSPKGNFHQEKRSLSRKSVIEQRKSSDELIQKKTLFKGKVRGNK